MFNTFCYKYYTCPKNAHRVNFLENHDEPRAARLFGWPECGPLVGFLFSLPGIPLVYNGQEAGFKRYLNLFHHQPMRWGRIDPMVYNCYRQLIHLQKSLPSLTTGALEGIPVKGHSNIVAFFRKKPAQKLLCLFNFSASSMSFHISSPFAAQTGRSPFSCQAFPGIGEYQIHEGQWFVRLQPWQSLMIWNNRER